MDIIIKYNETICIRTNFTKCLSRQLTYIKVKYIFAKLILFFNNELHEYQIQKQNSFKMHKLIIFFKAIRAKFNPSQEQII